MITWMQRHKKWLIITIWISTIAFVGAGFVGWGQYSYGDKAGSVAKTGEVEITAGELQRTYSNLFGQYNQMFQGNFDEAQAEKLGLKRHALEQLVQRALILNLAKEYEIVVTTQELFAALQETPLYNKEKEVYIKNLKNNNLTAVEFEAMLSKDILIQKVLAFLPVEASKNESKIFSTLFAIADKINYKLLRKKDIEVATSDLLLKNFWETSKERFMNEPSYDIKFIKQAAVRDSYSDKELLEHYNANKTHFKDEDGKIASLESVKESVIDELNKKATKEQALRNYIKYKKGKLDKELAFETIRVSLSDNPLNEEALQKISKLTLTAPYMKPILVDGVYHTIELLNINPRKIKTFQEAKEELLPLYISEKKAEKILELANNSLKNFSGTTTEFITIEDFEKISDMSQGEASEFLQKLFTSDKKQSFITLESGDIVLYNILEQKMLTLTEKEQGNQIAKIKGALFNEGLLKTLENKYPTEIFIQGL